MRFVATKTFPRRLRPYHICAAVAGTVSVQRLLSVALAGNLISSGAQTDMMMSILKIVRHSGFWDVSLA